MEKDVGKREMKKNQAANLVSSGTFPKITESEKTKNRKNRNGICCFLKPAFYFFRAFVSPSSASFIADSHTKSAVLSARDNCCAGSS